MTKKVKGVYWKSRDKKWLVRFRRNSQMIEVGRFDDYEQAATVANAWVQNNEFKKVHACVKCGVVGVGSQFAPYRRKGHCPKCWDDYRNDPWRKWVGEQLSNDNRVRRRKAKDAWEHWIIKKQVILLNREQPSSQQTASVAHSWDEWVAKEQARMQRVQTDAQRTGWERKIKQWAIGLQRRNRQKQRHEQNCEHC